MTEWTSAAAWSISGWRVHLGPGGVPADPGLTIPELAAASARRVPGRVAVSVDGQPVSHGQLDAQARRAAAWLAARLAPGERMLLAAGSGPGFLRWYLGALRAGVIVVLANPGYTAAELEHLVADSGARLAVADPGPAQRLAALAGPGGLAIVPAGMTPGEAAGRCVPGPAGRGRHRAARLHLRHHRAAQGCPADPPAAGRLHPGRHGGLAVERRRRAGPRAAPVPPAWPGWRARHPDRRVHRAPAVQARSRRPHRHRAGRGRDRAVRRARHLPGAPRLGGRGAGWFRGGGLAPRRRRSCGACGSRSAGPPR